MQPPEYGPFVNIVAVACALVAVFSAMLLKTLGSFERWAWLVPQTPSFLVTAGPRLLAVAAMGLGYLAVDSENYRWCVAAAVAFGLAGFVCVGLFDRTRQTHVRGVPQVAQDGSPLRDSNGKTVEKQVIIGREDQLRPEAATAFHKARIERGISLLAFMGGYGSPVNDPGALWSDDILVPISNRLTTLLMLIVLFAVLTLFYIALAIDAASRTAA